MSVHRPGIMNTAYLIFYYLSSLLGRRRPLLGGLKLTHACNLKCVHCPFWRRSQQALSFVDAVSAMEDLKMRGVRILIIEGGEPFLWNDGVHTLEDAVKEARRLFSRVGITTNGTFPLETGADVVWVSIDGLKPTHDRIRGESFDKIMANIEASHHPRIYAHITISRLNHLEIPELADFLADRVEGITIQFYYPYEEIEEDLFLPFEERRAVLDKLIELKKQGRPLADSFACLKALKDNRWKCRPWMIASVDPDGKVMHGCYVKDRGEIACERCGFAAHTEISLAYSGVPGAILTGRKIFG